MKLMVFLLVLVGGYFYIMTKTTDMMLGSVNEMYQTYTAVEDVTNKWSEGDTNASLVTSRR